MTPAVDERHPWLRRALAAVVAADLVSFYFALAEARVIAAEHGGFTLLNELASGVPVRGVVIAIGVVAAAAFGLRPGRLWAGAVSLVALAMLSTVHAQLFGGPWRHLYFSGVCLLGWLLGLLVSRRRGMPHDESWARMGSIALLGATYLSAGLSKLVYGGLDWMTGLPIQAVVVSQDGMIPDGVILTTYRLWVVETTALAQLLTIATVVLELGAALMVVGRVPRAVVALGLFAMHANIYLLTAILYWEAMVLLLLFGLSPDSPQMKAESASATPSRAFAAVAALLALCAALAVGHQGRRHALAESARAAGQARIEPTPVPPSPRRLRVGPFAVRDAVADGWTVESLAARDAGFVIMLAGQPGVARFEITCAPLPFVSPFDLERLHIIYGNDLQFAQLEPAGRAVQQRIRDAAADRDVCAALTAWLAAAEDPSNRVF